MTREWDKEKLWDPNRNWTHEKSQRARSFNWVHKRQLSCLLLGFFLCSRLSHFITNWSLNFTIFNNLPLFMNYFWTTSLGNFIDWFILLFAYYLFNPCQTEGQIQLQLKYLDMLCVCSIWKQARGTLENVMKYLAIWEIYNIKFPCPNTNVLFLRTCCCTYSY